MSLKTQNHTSEINSSKDLGFKTFVIIDGRFKGLFYGETGTFLGIFGLFAKEVSSYLKSQKGQNSRNLI